MIEPLLHEHARHALTNYIAKPVHALLLYGETGIGTATVAQWTAAQLSNPESIQLIQPDKGTIAIDTVRSLYAQTRSSRTDKLVVIIDDCDAMGGDAQNAFLKLLEEPPRHVYFILTTHSVQKLLPTITSRVRAIELQRLSGSDSDAFLSSLHSERQDTSKIAFLAPGLPAEMCRLASNKSYFESRAALMTQAKELLSNSAYERLKSLQLFMSDRQKASDITSMVGQLLSFTVFKTKHTKSAHSLNLVAQTIDALQQNANVRLQMIRLALYL